MFYIVMSCRLRTINPKIDSVDIYSHNDCETQYDKI